MTACGRGCDTMNDRESAQLVRPGKHRGGFWGVVAPGKRRGGVWGVVAPGKHRGGFWGVVPPGKHRGGFWGVVPPGQHRGWACERSERFMRPIVAPRPGTTARSS